MSATTWIEQQAGNASLGSQATRVVQVLTTHPRFASYATAGQVAERAGTNVSTVTRTAQGLGFTGWPDLQLEFRNRYLSGLTATEILTDHDTQPNDPVIAAFRQDSENLALASRALDLEAIRAIADTIGQARKTLVIGSGSFLAPGIMLAHIASLMGLDIDCDGLGGTHRIAQIFRMGPGDCLVVTNVWRLPREILTATRLAQERGVTTCVITDVRSNPLAAAGDHVVIVPCEGVAHFPSLTAAMAVVHGILSQLLANDKERLRATIAEGEETWRRLDLMVDQPRPS